MLFASPSVALPKRCIDALIHQRAQQESEREAAGDQWKEHGLVFASKVGTPLDPSHVRRATSGTPSRRQKTWTRRNGPPESYATASSRCYRTTACLWRRSPGL